MSTHKKQKLTCELFVTRDGKEILVHAMGIFYPGIPDDPATPSELRVLSTALLEPEGSVTLTEEEIEQAHIKLLDLVVHGS